MRLFYWNGYKYNFGDAMGPDIVKKVAEKNIGEVDGAKVGKHRMFERNLFALGSIFHMVRNGDVVWGTGVNHKDRNPSDLINVDIRAIRGPLTRDYIIKEYSLNCPRVYGDPALLLPKVFPEYRPEPKRKYAIVPHKKDVEFFISTYNNVILPNQNWRDVVSLIIECELIISSSLHGLIVAEAFGVPARWLHNQELPSSSTEGTFKYNDYYASTNRNLDDWVESVEEAVRVGGKEPISGFDCEKLLDAFPHDIFNKSRYYQALFVGMLEDLIRSPRILRKRLKMLKR